MGTEKLLRQISFNMFHVYCHKTILMIVSGTVNMKSNALTKGMIYLKMKELNRTNVIKK